MDWCGEYKKLNSFFQQADISHHVPCPYAMLISKMDQLREIIVTM
jgi:hypothetical protein